MEGNRISSLHRKTKKQTMPTFFSPRRLRRQPSEVFFRTRHAEDAASLLSLAPPLSLTPRPDTPTPEYESQDVSLFLEEEGGDFEGRGGAIVVWRCAGGRGHGKATKRGN